MKASLTSIIILISLFLSSVSAQFFMGASGGLNIASANIKIDGNPDRENFAKASALGFTHLGLLAGYRLGDKWSILMDAQLSHKGYHSFEPAQTDVRHRYTYLDFLPQVEYNIFKDLSIGTGFNVGFMTREMFRIGNGEWRSFDFVQTVILADIGWVGSIKYHYKKFFLVGRYNQGFLNINSNFLDDDVKHQNVLWQIGGGYIFHIAKGKNPDDRIY